MESIKHLYKLGYGPSSSHTMGPQKAVQIFLGKHPNIGKLLVTLYGSLALTGKGHMTDYVIEKTAAPIPVVFLWKSMEQKQHPNTMDIIGVDKKGNTTETIRFYSVGGGNIEIDGFEQNQVSFCYPHNYFSDIRKYCEQNNLSLVDYVNEFDSDIDSYLSDVWKAMSESISRGIKSTGILAGSLKLPRKAKILYESGNEQLRLASYAYAVNEENATASGLIVTAPTCGACGTLPAVLRFYQEKFNYSERNIIDALKVAGLIGTIIKTNASISGAVAGCQAEVGSATSMTAAALAQLHNSSISVIESAAEIAMEHQLGLTCDPVEGYVQIPCIQRNAIAAQKAVTSFDLAVTIGMSETVSFDTIVHVMYETGKDLPFAYRETSKGGLALHYKKRSGVGPIC